MRCRRDVEGMCGLGTEPQNFLQKSRLSCSSLRLILRSAIAYWTAKSPSKIFHAYMQQICGPKQICDRVLDREMALKI